MADMLRTKEQQAKLLPPTRTLERRCDIIVENCRTARAVTHYAFKLVYGLSVAPLQSNGDGDAHLLMGVCVPSPSSQWRPLLVTATDYSPKMLPSIVQAVASACRVPTRLAALTLRWMTNSPKLFPINDQNSALVQKQRRL
jgi:hypothetical protein